LTRGGGGVAATGVGACSPDELLDDSSPKSLYLPSELLEDNMAEVSVGEIDEKREEDEA
jgi:hypothetical protein